MTRQEYEEALERKKKGLTDTQDTQSTSMTREDYEKYLLTKDVSSVQNSLVSRLDTLNQNNSSVYEEALKRMSGDTYRDSADTSAWVSKVNRVRSDYMKEYSDIKNTLEKYNGVLDKSFVDDYSKYLEDNYSKLTEVADYSANERDYYAQWGNADEYAEYRKSAKEREGLLNYDTVKGQAEIDSLTKMRDSILGKSQARPDNLRNLASMVTNAKEKNSKMDEEVSRISPYSSVNELSQAIEDKQIYLNRAKRLQSVPSFINDAVNSPDFEQYASIGASIENPSSRGGWLEIGGKLIGGNTINNPVTYAFENPTEDENNYRFMTEDEVKAYNYYLAKENEGLIEKGTSQDFLNALEDELTQKRAMNDYTGLLEGNTLRELAFGVVSGLDQFGSGIRNLFDDSDYIVPSSTQYTSGMVREDLDDQNTALRVGYDVITTTSNMMPNILASILANAIVPGSGNIVGTALMGASAAGNEYMERLDSGLSKEDAKIQALIQGAWEGASELALGSIENLGMNALGNVVRKYGQKALSVAMQNTAKGFSRGVTEAIRKAADFGIDVLNEGFEEVIQDYGASLIDGIMTGKLDLPSGEDVGYEFALGMLSAFFLNGGQTALGNALANANAKSTYGDFQNELVAEGLESSEDTLSRYYAEKYQAKLDSGKNLTGRELNNLVNANDEAIKKEENTVTVWSDSAFADKTGVSVPDIKVSKPNESYVTKVESVNGKDIKLKDSEGNTISKTEALYKDTDEGMLYEGGLALGFDAETTNALVQSYDPDSNIPPSEYLLAAEEAINYGKIGYSQMAEDGLSSVFTPSQKKFFYNIGRQIAQNTTSLAQMRINEKKDLNVLRKGRVFMPMEISKNLTPRQKASTVAIGRVVADITRNNVHFFESVETDGKRVFKEDNPGGKKGETALNGFYDTKTGDIYIDVNAGSNGEGVMLYTFAHELTHFVREWSPEKFKALADFVMEEYGKNNISVDTLIAEQIRKSGNTRSYDGAFEEVIADAMQPMFTDTNLAEKLENLKAKDKTLWEKVKSFFADLFKKIQALYKGLDPYSVEGKLVKNMSDSIERISDLFAESIVSAGDNFSRSDMTLAETGIVVNDTNDFGSLKSVRDILDDKQRTKVVKALMQRFNVTEEEANGWISAETSLASLILNPKYSQYLDYIGDPDEEAIKKNADYPQGTVDFSNICGKRREFTAVMNSILRQFPGHVFQATDLAKIRTIMQEEGMTLPCGFCYVEDRRQLDSIVADTFISDMGLYKKGSKTRTDGKAFNENQIKALDLLKDDSYIPNIYELVTLEGRNKLKKEHPLVESAWVKYNNARGQQALRLLTNDAEYKRQILKYTKSMVNRRNNLGGLRIYSFSDLEMFHLIDIVQVLTDCATVGLAVQGYTKVNEYAKVVKDTGEKLNRSLIPLGDRGYHMEGDRVVLDFDTVEGIDINSKDFFDNKDNPNIGNIVIGVNNTHIRAAMVSPFIDQIIPFHTGQSAVVLEEKGISEWKNYKDFQTEKDITTGEATDKPVNIYTDVIQVLEKEGKEVTKRSFVEKYLEVCKKRNLVPKFAEAYGGLLDKNKNGDYIYTEGYHKLLVDFKTFAQTEKGEYLPQMPVKPIFDNGYMTGIMKKYVKNQKQKDIDIAEKMPNVLSRITNEIVRPEVRYSDRDSDGNKLTKEQIKYFNDSKVRSEDGTFKSNQFKTIDNGTPSKADGIRYSDRTEEVTKLLTKKGKKYNELADKRDSSEKFTFKEFNSFYHAHKIFSGKTDAEKVNIIDSIIKNGFKSGMNSLVPINVSSANNDNSNISLLKYRPKEGERVLLVPDFWVSHGTGKDQVTNGYRPLPWEIIKVEYNSQPYYEAYAKAFNEYHGIQSDDYIVNKYRGYSYDELVAMRNDLIKKATEGKDESAWDTIYEIGSHLTRYFDKNGVKYSARDTVSQEYNSAKTSRPQIPALFKDSRVQFGKTNVDVGGGKYDFATNYLTSNGTTNYIFDPYNRDASVNKKALSVIKNGGADTSTNADVLNVIKEESARDNVILEMAKAIKRDGTAYFMVYEGDGSGVGRVTSDGWQNNLKTYAYVPEIEKYFDSVDRKGKLIIAKNPKANLPKASWELSNGGEVVKFSDRYDAKQRYIDNLNSKNARVTKLDEDQHNAIVTLARLRHELHSNWDSLWNAESSGYDRLWGYLPKDGEPGLINEILEEANLPTIEFPDFSDVPTSIFYDFQNEYSDMTEWKENSGDYDEFAEALGKANNLIESYLLKIDDENGTQYAPTGYARLYNSERSTNPTDNRTLLANALETAAQNETEKKYIADYKAKISDINQAQKLLSDLRSQIKELSFSKGQRDRAKLSALQSQATKLANNISTFDKQLLRLEASKPLKDVLEREKSLAVKREQERARETLANYRANLVESLNKQTYIKRIEAIAYDLQKRIEHPSAKRVIPEVFAKSVANFLKALDFTTYDRNGAVREGKANQQRQELRTSITNLANSLSERTIEDEYGQLDISPEMLDWIKSISMALDSKYNVDEVFEIRKMDATELGELYKIIKGLQISINNVSKFYTDSSSNVSDLAMGTIEHLKPLYGRERLAILDTLGKIFAWDYAQPMTVFDRFGESGKTLMKMLTGGQKKEAFNIQDIINFVDGAYTEDEVRKWREELHKVEISGKEYEVPTAFLMELHCLLKDKDARRHILEGGGIRFDDLKVGKTLKRFSDTFITEDEVNAIEGMLTSRQKEVADNLQKYMGDKGAIWGNEISMIRFGYHAFGIENYYPIKTIKAGSEYEATQKRANIYALLNKSFTKERVLNANNTIIVSDIFQTFNNHMSEMALYNAWALPVIDLIKWFNYREGQDLQKRTNEISVKEALRQAYGKNADEYIRRLLEAINSTSNGGLSESIAFRSLRLVNRVAVAGNIRVAIQQPFSITRAMELINPKYFRVLVGKARKSAFDEMVQNTSFGLWKSMGYYDVDVSRPLEVKVLKNATLSDKITEKTMIMAEDGDAFTWSVLWNACKLEANDKNPNATPEELISMASEKFDDIILRTQVVDSVLIKSQWMRSSSFFHRMTSAFMSEPMTSYNTLLRRFDRFNRDLALHGRKEAINLNGKAIAKTTAIFILTQLVNALVTAPIDAMRDDDDYKTFIEKMLEKSKGNAVENLIPANMMPYVSDIVEYAIYGKTDRPDLQIYTKVIDFAKQIKTTIESYDYFKLHKLIKSGLSMVSSLTGLPMSNIMRDAVSVWNTTVGSIGDGSLKFQTSKDSSSVGYDKMYEALRKGDESGAMKVFVQMQSNLVSPSSIRSGLTERIKKDYVEGNIDLAEATRILTDVNKYIGEEITASDIYWIVDKWEYQKAEGTSEGYSKYDDFFKSVETGVNLKETIRLYTDNGVDKTTLSSQITSHFKPLYVNMSKTEKTKLKGYLLNAYSQLGYNRSDKARDIDNWK